MPGQRGMVPWGSLPMDSLKNSQRRGAEGCDLDPELRSALVSVCSPGDGRFALEPGLLY